MPEYLQNLDYSPYKENVCILGAAQHGKTTEAINLAKMLVGNFFNVIIHDFHCRFTTLNPFSVKRFLHELTGIGLEIFQPPIRTREEFDNFCAKVLTFKNTVAIIDELHNYCEKNSHPKNLKLLFENCNNRSIGYVAILQRPAEVPNFVLSNSTHRFCLYLDLPTDIVYMKKWIGKDVENFASDSIPKFEGIYKKVGEKSKRFRVEK